MKLIQWIFGMVEDPQTKKLSSSRVAALGFVVAGCFLALTAPEHTATISVLVVGGGVALLTRTKPEV